MPPQGRVGQSAEEQVQQACAELVQRLRAGETCSAEEMLAAQPDLTGEAVLELIYTEFVVCEQLGQHPDPADWYARFPQWRNDLEQLFQVHRAVGADLTLDPTASLIPFPGSPNATDGCAPNQLGGYELLGELGRGGMGVVYKARQPGLARLVALKVILAGELSGPHERARFRAEAEAAARLQHPHIVQVHEVGQHDGRPYLALELVEGGSLQERLVRAPWLSREAAELVEALARAMQHAHERGVIHRDLKPGNVLLTADGSPKITDFGLARRLSRGDTDATRRDPTTTGAVVGTPGYMAPEQAAGASRQIGLAADIYALGAILYALLTGRPPFQGVSALDILDQVRTCEPLPPSRLQPKLPRDLETICLKCLRKEPAKRYANAEALAKDLQRFLAGQPIQARPTPPWERALKWAKRRPTVAALLVALATSIVLSLAVVTVLWRETAAALRAEQSERTRAEAALAGKTIALARQQWLANDIEQARRLLGECPPAYRNREWRYLDCVCSACRLTLITNATSTAPPCLAWSPDGQQLASTAIVLLPVVKVWDMESGRERVVLTKNTRTITQAAFTADGQLVTAGHYQFINRKDVSMSLEVKVWSMTGGEPIRGFEGLFSARLIRGFDDPRPIWSTALSHDGKRLVTSGKDGLRHWDIAGGRELRTIPRGSDGDDSPIAVSADGQMMASTVFVKGPGMTIRVRDSAGQFVAKLPYGEGTAGTATFSPDSRRLAAAVVNSKANSSRVQVWDVASGRELITLRGHSARIACVAFSPDGRLLATGSQDRTVIVWDATTGEELLTLRGHQDQVTLLAFRPDGRRLASASNDGTVKIWDVQSLEGGPG